MKYRIKNRNAMIFFFFNIKERRINFNIFFLF